MGFPDQPFGFVAGRWVLSIGDTPDDPDRAPDYVPVPEGKITFRPLLSHRVVPDCEPGSWAGVINREVEGRLGAVLLGDAVLLVVEAAQGLRSLAVVVRHDVLLVRRRWLRRHC